jgi:hypothetical protein
MFDPMVDALGQYNWISQQSYPSPVYIGRVSEAIQDTVYKATSWPMHTTLQVTYSVPQYTYKVNQNSVTKRIDQTNLGYLNGAAPTTGIYTGIPSGCSGNGTHGGNPYS